MKKTEDFWVILVANMICTRVLLADDLFLPLQLHVHTFFCQKTSKGYNLNVEKMTTYGAQEVKGLKEKIKRLF